MAWLAPEARIIMQAEGIHNCFPPIEKLIMCLLIFAHQVYPGYPLVLAANRDEFYARETAPSAFWPEHPNMLAGKDLQAGGTWMGVTRQGRFAAITNYRDPAATGEAPRSRGELTLDFLSGSTTPPIYLGEVAKRAAEYAGFSLLLGDGKYLWHCSNRHTVCGCTPISPQMLQPGIYGLSNAKLNTPWPKVELGKARLKQLLENAPPDHDSLLGLVNDRKPASTEALKLQGMDTEMEQVLSAQFILAGEYGTRSSTTMWTDDAGTTNWRELSFDRQGGVSGTVEKQLETTKI